MATAALQEQNLWFLSVYAALPLVCKADVSQAECFVKQLKLSPLGGAWDGVMGDSKFTSSHGHVESTLHLHRDLRPKDTCRLKGKGRKEKDISCKEESKENNTPMRQNRLLEVNPGWRCLTGGFPKARELSHPRRTQDPGAPSLVTRKVKSAAPQKPSISPRPGYLSMPWAPSESLQLRLLGSPALPRPPWLPLPLAAPRRTPLSCAFPLASLGLGGPSRPESQLPALPAGHAACCYLAPPLQSVCWENSFIAFKPFKEKSKMSFVLKTRHPLYGCSSGSR